MTREQLYYFYNLQPVNNSCPGDQLGPPAVYQDTAFPPEDRLYATLLLNASAEVVLTSGWRTDFAASAVVAVPPGLHSFSVLRQPGLQNIRVVRNGVLLANATGAERVNASTDPAVTARCDHQTFAGSAAW